MTGPQTIQLGNPSAAHFPAFIFGNATHCDRVAEKDSAAGQHIVICGAGPSLADHIAEWAPQADQIWGCNSAVTWLHANGHKPTHGFCIDQGAQMLTEWVSAPPVEYLLASTVHPHLTEYLISKGRAVRFFHNFVGVLSAPVQREDGTVLSYEDWMYSGLYPATVRCGSGLNAVSRAIDVATFMGAAQITVLGADCALRVTKPLGADVIAGSPEHMRWLREDTVMHADGGHALASGATPLTLVGVIDGRRWDTKPDLIITATFLAQMARTSGGKIRLIGDTLPNALIDKPAEYLARLPGLRTTDGEEVQIKGRNEPGVGDAATAVEVVVGGAAPKPDHRRDHIDHLVSKLPRMIPVGPDGPTRHDWGVSQDEGRAIRETKGRD